MAITIYTIKDLALFTNQDESYYTPFADTTIAQATLLFKLATCLKDMPDDEDYINLVKYAILSMAQSFYETDKYSESKFSPFSSESIGSYSYTKAMTRIKSGEPTGVMWFDTAVGELGVCDLMGGSGIHSGGGIEVFEHDGTFVPGTHPGNQRLLAPNDIGDFPDFSLDGN